jgi:hypothetical protein
MNLKKAVEMATKELAPVVRLLLLRHLKERSATSRNQRGICHKRTQRSQKNNRISPCFCVPCVPLRQESCRKCAILTERKPRETTDFTRTPGALPSVVPSDGTDMKRQVS